jgi:hypothetical protein
VKSDGHVAIVDWSDPLSTERRGVVRIGPAKEDVLKKGEAIELAKKAGLAITREFEAGAHHYGIILMPAPLS